MRILGKETTTKMLAFIAIMALCAGFASAALVNYVANSMTATVTVSPEPGLTVGVVKDLQADPTDPAIAWQTSGTIDLTGAGFTAGDTSIITLMVDNPTSVPIAASLNLALSYADTGVPAVGDPGNCNPATGEYSAPGAGTCLVCNGGTTLCVDGEEFDVIGMEMWNSAIGKWDPELDNTFGLGGCIQNGLPNAGDISNWGYNDGTNCWWNFQDELSTAPPANPLIASQGPITIQPGTQYIAVALKTKADPSANVQLAPGQYSLTVTTS